ncbi:MAG: PEP-CTERM sorting domain-containing protein [Phycisphaerales bacterium]|nr:PEP-CTERM sorting domain-containing protein [Phycisphaerales bacterium]
MPAPSFAPQFGGVSTGLSSTIMQTYNYGANYEVRWSNTPVPAPGAAALIGLAGMVSSRRRRN